MLSVLRYLLGTITPPDIRKIYRFKRRAEHLFKHAAVQNDSVHACGNACRSLMNFTDRYYDRYITSSDYRKIKVRVYQPRLTAARGRIIVFFHGGGWVTADIDSYHKVCAQFSQISGSCVVSVDYRLAPESKFPSGFDDCYAAARAVFARAKAYGYRDEDIILMGDSAGGNLAAAVSLKARDTGEFRVKRQVLIYPVTACEFDSDSPYRSVHENGNCCILSAERMRGYLELYLNDISEKNDPYVAPVKADSFTNLPQTLVITAQYDMLRDEGEAYARKLDRAGGDVMAFRIKNAYHGFFSTDIKRNPHAKKAMGMIMYFLNLTDK